MTILHKLALSSALGLSLLGMSACAPSETQAQEQVQKQAQAQTTEATHDEHAEHSHDAPAAMSAALEGVPSGNYTMDKGHGYVTFSYLHQGLSHPQLRFRDVDATLVLDADSPENSQVSVSIKAASIDSGVDKFDDHLNGADFFNSTENPEITFKSTSFHRDSATTGTMTGDLTMMGATKALTLDVVLVGTKDGDKPALGVDATATVLRSDFALGKYVPYVGDEVELLISAEFHKDK